jgi:hypothetical protein
MSASKFQPHVLVLPEDDANSDLANGFLLELDAPVSRQLQVLPASGGWRNVLNDFESNYVSDMDRYADRRMVLLIDFDGREDRLNEVKRRIPGRLSERVFILGAMSEPEALRAAGLGTYEVIGRAMAKDCREGTDTTWGHDLLRNNAGEIGRLRQHVRPILF